MIKKHLPKIETERLKLSHPKNSDLDKITEILNNEVYSKNTINIPYPYTKKSAEFWLQLAENGIENQNQYIFVIHLKDNDEIIGGIDLGVNKRFNNAELGFWLDEKYWNKGYTTEAVKSIIQFGFKTLKLKRIFATHFDFNISSGKVLEKSGMKKEGFLESYTCKDGVYQNHILYAIIKE